MRGLGGLEKRKELRKLVDEKKPFILCLQETKLVVCDDFLCTSVWGDINHDFSFRPSMGASGGLLTMWDTKEVEVWSSVRNNEEFYVFNIYAPCEPRAKQELWASLADRLQLLGGEKVCVCGDFNVVRKAEERRSVRGLSSVQEFQHFNLFIDENGLIDLPLCGRRFTWYKGDDTSMSRIDRFLISEAWCLQWPNCFQVALLRGLSDHCPLQLSVDEEN